MSHSSVSMVPPAPHYATPHTGQRCLSVDSSVSTCGTLNPTFHITSHRAEVSQCRLQYVDGTCVDVVPVPVSQQELNRTMPGSSRYQLTFWLLTLKFWRTRSTPLHLRMVCTIHSGCILPSFASMSVYIG